MESSRDRLERGAELLERLDRMREDTRSPKLGYDKEFAVIDRELRDLERDIEACPGALEAMLVRVRRSRPL